jgi:NADPH:quinone reductase-like Zn-dependent oxidoreductase
VISHGLEQNSLVGLGEMLTRSAKVQAGYTVLFQGVGGGVGTAFMQVARNLGKILKTASSVGAVFAPNLVPGGKRTSLYSIQMLARRHPGWYRQDLTALLEMLANGAVDPQVAAIWKLDEVPAADGLAHGALPGKQVVSVARP